MLGELANRAGSEAAGEGDANEAQIAAGGVIRQLRGSARVDPNNFASFFPSKSPFAADSELTARVHAAVK